MSRVTSHVRHEWPAPGRRYELLEVASPGARQRYRSLDGPAHVVVLRGSAEVTAGGEAAGLTAGQRADVTAPDELTLRVESGLVELYLPAEVVPADE